MASKRFEELDFIKAISIIMVVGCHQHLLPKGSFLSNVGMMLCYAAVPCFFMCSGYVSAAKPVSLSKQLRRIFQTYAVFVLWRVLYYIFYFNTKYWSMQTHSRMDILSYLFLFKPLYGVSLGHFWFMEAYLGMLMLMPLISALFMQKKACYCGRRRCSICPISLCTARICFRKAWARS